MRRNLLGILIMLATGYSSLLAQAPQQMNYQAVVRDNSGSVVADSTPVTFRFTIHDGTPGGTPVFTETQNTYTGKLGLVNLQIGSVGDLSHVSWGSGAKYLQIEANINNAGFATMGSSELISVPFALYANNSGSSLAGPTGAPGATGVAGATGLQGNQGATGVGTQGLPGVTGPTGPQGLQGSVGPAGQQGIAGEQGVTGLPGVTGPTGIGETGATGMQGPGGGATGPTGATGETGLQGPGGGATGPTGAQGIQGPTGAAGATGQQGIQGVQGPAGPQGPQGIQGYTGAIGNQGVQGVTGATGTQGLTGLPGATGAQGATGNQGLPGNMGATGLQGNAGPTGLTGAQGPTGQNGVTGAMGIQGVTGAKGATGFGLQGATGATGPTGLTGSGGGATGPMGATGNNGTQGPTGATGAVGATGAAGAIGATGTGIQGNTGATGPSGTAGNTGATGANGPTGIGLQGATGANGPTGLTGPTGPVGCTTADLVLKSDGVNATCSQIYDNGTAVGIGTTAPVNQFDVYSGLPGINTISGTNSYIDTGQMWGSSLSYSGVVGMGAASNTEFGAGVYGYQLGVGKNSGGVVGAYSEEAWGGLGYTDSTGANWGVYSSFNLYVSGHMTMVDGNQAAGKVLTSDANGIASWQTGVSVAGVHQGNTLEWDTSGNHWVAANITTGNTGGGQPVNNMQPYLVINYCIATSGIFPSRNDGDPFVGEIELFGFNFAPNGFALCNGQIMAISTNTALFSLLGTTYGGNGTSTFALPDLQGRTPLHMGTSTQFGTNYVEGQTGGTETNTITISQMPAHNHPVIFTAP